jgi:hypothetical protein
MARFGTFTGLGQTSSSSTDTDPNTPTLSFHGAKYTSKYFTFAGYEQTDRNQQPLDTVPAADQKLLAKYDATPYLPSSSAGSIPFIFFGGKYIISGASYDPGTLAGMTHAQVAKAMSDPTSKVAQGIDGTANVVSALICTMTNQQPANVCSSSGVQAAAKLFNSAG